MPEKIGRKKIDKLVLYKQYEKRMTVRNEKPLTMNEWEKKNRPTGETKNEKFVRLGKVRMNKTLKSMDTLINLSGSGYDHTNEQAEKIITALKNKINEIETGLNKTKSNKEEFNL